MRTARKAETARKQSTARYGLQKSALSSLEINWFRDGVLQFHSMNKIEQIASNVACDAKTVVASFCLTPFITRNFYRLKISILVNLPT
jgi:hypothetical protein